VRIVSASTIRDVVSLADARQAVHDAFCALSRGDVVAPDELAMKLAHGGELHIKGAYLGGDVIAFKAATGQFPAGGNSGFTAVLDASTGAPVALLADGGWLTEIRTAAASAVSTRALARPNATKLAILGGGIQATFQVAAMREACAIEDLAVWSRTAETAARFAEENDGTAHASVNEAVAGADVIICCTPSTKPLLEFGMVQPGTHIVAMGSDMIGKRELAADLLAGCTLVSCDDRTVAGRVGELQHASDQFDRAVNLGDVLTGAAEGRQSDADITVTDLCGLGIQDVAMAELVMSRLPSNEEDSS